MNFDLQENEINKYIIYREAVILTIDEKGFYESNTFNGIQIRRIGIDTSNEIKDFFEQQQAQFVCGELDIDNDADWQAYVDGMYSLGLEDWVATQGIEEIAK